MLPKSSAWPTSPQGPSMHPHQHRGFFPPDFRLTAQTLSVRGSSWDVTFKPRLVCPDRTGPCSTFHQTLKPPGIQNGFQKVWTELGKGSANSLAGAKVPANAQVLITAAQSHLSTGRGAG